MALGTRVRQYDIRAIGKIWGLAFDGFVYISRVLSVLGLLGCWAALHHTGSGNQGSRRTPGLDA